MATNRITPPIGYGTWKIPNETCPETVYEAIKLGVRHIDCATDYGNEEDVGKGIKKAIDEGIVKREELFVVGKLWQTFHAPEHVEMNLDKCLKDLGLDYLDLWIIHFPIALQFVPIETRYPSGWFDDPSKPDKKIVQVKVPLSATWGAMEKCVDNGKAKYIGVSNYNVQTMMDLLAYCRIKPLCNQVELHPYNQQPSLVRFLQDNDIEVVAYSPLGSSSYIEIGLDQQAAIGPLEEPIIKDLAAKKGKSPGQVILRWGYQRGCAVIPKSSRPARLLENFSIFDFELSAEEMASIATLNKNLRFNDPGVYFSKEVGGPLPIFD
jgi:D-xylose reductase